jgi:hypothetical protein
MWTEAAATATAVVLIGSGALVSTARADHSPIQPIAMYQQPAPSPPGALFNRVGFPRAHRSGQIMFHASVFGGGINSSNDVLLWTGTSASVRPIAREGTNAPGTPAGVVFGESFFRQAVNPQHAAFITNLTGPGVDETNDGGLWAGPHESLHLVAREGDVVAALPALRYAQSLELTALEDSGWVLFGAQLEGPGVEPNNDRAYFYGPPQAPQLLVREGAPAPGTSGTLAEIRLAPSNGNGVVGMLANINASPSNRGLWYGAGGSFTLLAREGLPAPGTPAGVLFDLFPSFPRIESSGVAAFRATLRGAGVTSANAAGIWVGTPGAVELLVRQGDPAPGTGGAMFGRSNTFEVQINDRNEVLFQQLLQGPGVTPDNADSIWLASHGDFRLIARQGDEAPGTGGARFGSFVDSFPSLSDSGWIAFNGKLTGSGVTTFNDTGLWVARPDGSVELIVREGMTFDFGGFPRTVTAVHAAAASWHGGARGGVTDLNELIIGMEFGLGGPSGAFVTVVPEPAGLAAVALFSIAVGMRRGHGGAFRPTSPG